MVIFKGLAGVLQSCLVAMSAALCNICKTYNVSQLLFRWKPWKTFMITPDHNVSGAEVGGPQAAHREGDDVHSDGAAARVAA